MVSNFNAHLRNKVVAIADEAFFARDPRQDRVLKGMITGEWLRIEPKGVDSFQVPNYLHLIIIGNDSALVHATMDERRYFALECSEVIGSIRNTSARSRTSSAAAVTKRCSFISC